MASNAEASSVGARSMKILYKRIEPIDHIFMVYMLSYDICRKRSTRSTICKKERVALYVDERHDSDSPCS